MTEQQWDVDVQVMPKAGVNDPEGEAILGGLRSLGYGSVERVRAGRLIRLVVAAPNVDAAEAEAARMADQLLANPVIEVYTITVSGRSGVESPI